jgi:hypothetical protein
MPICADFFSGRLRLIGKHGRISVSEPEKASAACLRHGENEDRDSRAAEFINFRRNTMEFKLFGSDFQAWKLHTVSDYVGFFAYLGFGILFFFLVIKYMNSQRNHVSATKKVMKRLKRLAKKPSKVYKSVTLKLPDGKKYVDGVVADMSGIYLIRTYSWGIRIYGSPEGATWRREDAKRKEKIDNPLPELKDAAEKLQALLEEKGVPKVKIMPMVVFADNYQTPELYLGYGSFSTTYQELKKWYKKQAGVKEAQYDVAKAISVLDGICINA